MKQLECLFHYFEVTAKMSCFQYSWEDMTWIPRMELHLWHACAHVLDQSVNKILPPGTKILKENTPPNRRFQILQILDRNNVHNFYSNPVL